MSGPHRASEPLEELVERPRNPAVLSAAALGPERVIPFPSTVERLLDLYDRVPAGVGFVVANAAVATFTTLVMYIGSRIVGHPFSANDSLAVLASNIPLNGVTGYFDPIVNQKAATSIERAELSYLAGPVAYTAGSNATRYLVFTQLLHTQQDATLGGIMSNALIGLTTSTLGWRVARQGERMTVPSVLREAKSIFVENGYALRDFVEISGGCLLHDVRRGYAAVRDRLTDDG